MPGAWEITPQLHGDSRGTFREWFTQSAFSEMTGHRFELGQANCSVSAAIGTAFVQDSPEAAREQWRAVADQLRAKFPKLSALMDEAEHDVLAFMTFPRAHWPQIYSTNPLERLNAEIKRRTNVVGIFPNDASITRLVGAMMLEQNDEWSLNRRYMQLEGLQTLSDTLPTRLAAVAR